MLAFEIIHTAFQKRKRPILCTYIFFRVFAWTFSVVILPHWCREGEKLLWGLKLYFEKEVESRWRYHVNILLSNIYDVEKNYVKLLSDWLWLKKQFISKKLLIRRVGFSPRRILVPPFSTNHVFYLFFALTLQQWLSLLDSNLCKKWLFFKLFVFVYCFAFSWLRFLKKWGFLAFCKLGSAQTCLGNCLRPLLWILMGNCLS